MTLEDLNKLDDRALDALVAEKVMGWRVTRATGIDQGAVYTNDPKQAAIGGHCAYYCSDRNASAEALEKLKQKVVDEDTRLSLDMKLCAQLERLGVETFAIEILTAPPRTLMISALLAIGE